MFRDISTDWNSCLVNGNDFRELIPEFYQENVEFLMNFKKLDLGMTVNGEKVAEIKLPAWASSEKEFLSTMRKALESEFVSENLHHWIDLIFGYKQRGEQAIFCNNCECLDRVSHILI